MTTNDIDAARKLTDAATPGPWIADGWEIYENVERNWVAETLDTDNHERSYADAEFIAAARTLVPALCDEIEHLRAELNQMRDQSGRYGHQRNDLAVELEKVRGQYADTRRHNDLLTAELADQQRANTTWANENQRLRDRLFADKPVVDAALAWVEMYETSDNGVRGSKAEDDLCDAVEQYRVMDMALDAAHGEQAEVAK